MQKTFYLFLLFGIFSLSIHAQSLTQSPYSRYGIGELFNYNNTRNSAMGGIGIGSTSVTSACRLNPAAYMDLKRTTLDVSGFANFSLLKTKSTDVAQQQATKHTVGFRDLSFLFPTNKNAAIAFGFAPYSALGYAIADNDSIFDGDSLVVSQINYASRGGLNQAYVGGAMSFLKGKLRAGANAYFSFGNIQYEWTSLPATNYTHLAKINRTTYMRGFGAQLGVQYQDTLKANKEKDELVFIRVGASADIPLNINYDRLTTFSSIASSVASGITDTMGAVVKGKIALPIKSGLGFEISSPMKWSVGADVIMQNWKKMDTVRIDNRFNLGNDFRIGIGGEWTPNWKTDNFFKRVNYRAGGYYNSTYLNFNGVPIKDMGVSLGVGIPMNKNKAISTLFNSGKFNLSVELGQRGSLSATPLSEKYAKIRMGLTINELWFVRRKVD
jgi:hypothetical protein